jgi:UDP-sulfoquinovose synthase
MKIIVLGADGYLGWPTCIYLASKGHEVVAVDNYLKRRIVDEVGARPLIEMPRLAGRTKLFEEASGAPMRFEELDICDFAAMSKLFAEEQPDCVVHYGEQPSGPYSMMGYKEAQLTLSNNVGGTLSVTHAILENCPDCHIVKLATMGEYGTPKTDIPEGFFEFEYNGRKDTRLFPREAGSLYHTCKILETDLMHFYVRMKGLRVTDLMQGPVYGSISEPGVSPDLGTHFYYDAIFGTALNRFVVQAVVGHPLTVYGKGNQTRGYLDIRDTVECVRLACESPPERGELRVMNQFTEDFSALDLASRVQAAGADMKLDVKIEHITNPRIESEDHYYNAENKKLLDLGLEPHFLDNETLIEMIEYVHRHRDQIDESLILPKVKW